MRISKRAGPSISQLVARWNVSNDNRSQMQSYQCINDLYEINRFTFVLMLTNTVIRFSAIWSDLVPDLTHFLRIRLFYRDCTDSLVRQRASSVRINLIFSYNSLDLDLLLMYISFGLNELVAFCCRPHVLCLPDYRSFFPYKLQVYRFIRGLFLTETTY